MYNIYILNYLTERERGKEWKQLLSFCLLFLLIYVKAAFDSIDRELLWKRMEERGVRKSLMDRVIEIYEKTILTIQVNRKSSELF